jgi:dCMP deaminase
MSMRRPDWDEYFMLYAEIAKLRSNCITRHVGAVIVKENRQIATGYNGTPSGIKNCFEGGCIRCKERIQGKIKSGEQLDRCLCTHAEANAIMQCALFGNAGSTRNATLYTTYTPCIECSKMAVGVGITRIVVLGSYPEDVTKLLKETNIQLIHLDRSYLKRWITLIDRDSEVSRALTNRV